METTPLAQQIIKIKTTGDYRYQISSVARRVSAHPAIGEAHRPCSPLLVALQGRRRFPPRSRQFGWWQRWRHVCVPRPWLGRVRVCFSFVHGCSASTGSIRFVSFQIVRFRSFHSFKEIVVQGITYLER